MRYFITIRSEFEKLMNLSNHSAKIQAYQSKLKSEEGFSSFPAMLLDIKEDLIGFSISDSMVDAIKPPGKFSFAPIMETCHFNLYGKTSRNDVIESKVISVAGRFAGNREYINETLHPGRIKSVIDAYITDNKYYNSSGLKILPTVTTLAKYEDYSKFNTEGIVTTVKLEFDLENGYTFIKEVRGAVISKLGIFEDEDDGFYPIETSPFEILSRLSDALDLVFLSQYPKNHIKALEGKSVVLSKMKVQQEIKNPIITPQQYNYLRSLASKNNIPNVSSNDFKNITKFEAGAHISSLERYGKLAIVG